MIVLKKIFGLSLIDLKRIVDTKQPVVKGIVALRQGQILLIKRSYLGHKSSVFDIWQIISTQPALVYVCGNVLEDFTSRPEIKSEQVSLIEQDGSYDKDGLYDNSKEVQSEIKIGMAYKKVIPSGSGFAGGWPDRIQAVWEITETMG